MSSFKQFLAESSLPFNHFDISKDAKLQARQWIASQLKMSDAEFAAISKKFFVNANEKNLLQNYNRFQEEYPSYHAKISAMNPKGVGPGEIVLYFLFNNIGIGGASSPIDVYLDGKPFAEVKGGKVSGGTITDFKMSSDSSPAVETLKKQIEEFNSKHEEITGDPLPSFKSIGEIGSVVLKSWRDINLKDLAKKGGSSKKSIDLTLRTDGKIFRDGEKKPIVNVNTAKSIEPLKKLITDKVPVKDEISTIDAIEKTWATGVMDDYAADKNFLFIDTKNKKAVFFGKLSADDISLFRLTLGQPKAAVNIQQESKK